MSKLFNEIVFGAVDDELTSEQAIKKFRRHGMNESEAIILAEELNLEEGSDERTDEIVRNFIG